ncbi:CDP-glycerol glycerophosphotransferase family protein [Hornefia butyriciproducens]|uniref:CDP-glycerol glycerophosphotransferase family protein n=1 Tax=Hornefia butyriciproducens TaxID=2652293 RepID=UPI0023EFBE72|nr:CDP-glycerol glycerophosphotransferase family protein [Hornefia butyriciproducens]
MTGIYMEQKEIVCSVVIHTDQKTEELKKALRALENQTAGFPEGTQVLLIENKGDEEQHRLCSDFREKYGENVRILSASTVSSLKELRQYIRGCYVNISGEGDYWDADALRIVRKAISALPQSGGQTVENDGGSKIPEDSGSGNVSEACPEIITCRREYHGKRSGFVGAGDRNFRKSHLCKTDKRPKEVLYDLDSSFIPASLLTGEESALEAGAAERQTLIGRLALRSGRIRYLREAVCHVSDVIPERGAWDFLDRKDEYFSYAEAAYSGIIECSRNYCGEVTAYAQNFILGDLQTRLKQPLPQEMSREERTAYRELISRILGEVEDLTIVKSRLPLPYKAYALRLKYGDRTFPQELLLNRIPMQIRMLEERDGMLHLEGVSAHRIPGENRKFCAVDAAGREWNPLCIENSHYDRKGMLGDLAQQGIWFTLDLPLKEDTVYRFRISDSMGNCAWMPLKLQKWSRLSGMENSFFLCGNRMVSREENGIAVSSGNLYAAWRAAKRRDSILKKLGKPEVLRIRKRAAGLKRKAKKRPIWLVFDRAYRAGDNGEALFRYLMKSDVKQSREIYFVLNADSEDYERMAKAGPVLKYGSEEHLAYFLAASEIISSAADQWVINPFGKDRKYYQDMIESDFVFLQHGVTQQDVSGWLHRGNLNIKLFVTSAGREYSSVLDGNYGYDESVVKLTGMPRHDRLRDHREKLIAFLPTWRKDLAGTLSDRAGERKYSESFRESEYFRFYDGLIHSPELLEAMERAGYRGEFHLHPSLRSQLRDFQSNPLITVGDDQMDYSGIFARASLLITDYSSVAFDFAYLRKPVVYTQFDRNDIEGRHIFEKGYFDYEQDGFGPVVYDLQTAIDAIVRFVASDCAEPELYRDRVDTFFRYNDRRNSERVCREIIRMEDSTRPYLR